MQIEYTPLQNLVKIEHEVKRLSTKYGNPTPKVLIVSKYASVEEIRAIHEQEPKKHFGENYVEALVEKASLLPMTIKWHFVGHLQSNKCKYLLGIPNLHMIETVDSMKLAVKINDTLKKLNVDKKEVENDVSKEPKRIQVLIQIKTNRDENKTGMIYDNFTEIEQVVLCILQSCDYVIFRGLMTISSLEEAEREKSFIILNEVKRQLLKNHLIHTHFKDTKFIMSMGMSSDVDFAIKHGSTQVRIGSAIFNS